MIFSQKPSPLDLVSQRTAHTEAIANGTGLPLHLDLTLSEALIIGLIRLGVKTYLTVFGHGSTEIGEVLRIYHEAGLVNVYGVRSEIEASHAAAALRWATGEKAAVVTSIGPGALQALAASLAPASNGIGLWYLFGDETTEDEGYNMQQIPKHQQGLFLQLTSTMGHAYSLHTSGALPTALRRGSAIVDHPYRPGPFYLLLPMNTQSAWIPNFNLGELPEPHQISLGAAEGDYVKAAEWIRQAERVIVKVGGGGRGAKKDLQPLLENSGGVLVHTPIASGCIPYTHPHYMGVSGSKGSLCGNYAMENADLLIAVGTRAVCQSDCSRTGYPNVKNVININADTLDATHYNHTLALVGDVSRTLAKLSEALNSLIIEPSLEEKVDKSEWLSECATKKYEWQALKAERERRPVLDDEYWGEAVLTQPAAIKIATDWAKKHGALCFFDSGDVQANGFQIIEDDQPGRSFTEIGASYMGFAASAVLATALASQPFYALALTGDGAFTMNPQILIDGAEHGAHGCILLLDNGRMGAISSLQNDQYGQAFATWNTIHVDYLAWASAIPGVLAVDGGRNPESLRAALDKAGEYPGLSLIHVPIYFGPDPLGGMGVYGRWNVGNWCDQVQALRHKIGL